MKKYSLLIVLAIFTVIFVACSNDNKAKPNGTADPAEPIMTEDERIGEDEVVASVNGTDIKGITYNLVYTQLKLFAMQTGDEESLAELKDLTVTSLVDREILMQEAKKEGIEVSEAEAEDELSRLKAEDEKVLDTILDQFQINEAEFVNQLRFELTMNDYMQLIEVPEVSDAEIEEYYEKAKAENKDIPELDEVKGNIESQIKNQKTSDELDAKIAKIKEKAEIDIKI